MSNNKAQIAGQVFIFMLALILAAMILLYGYNAIFGKDGFIHRTEQIVLVRFETEIGSEVRKIASNYGDVKKIELNLPSEFKEVCLIDRTKGPPSNLKDSHPIIYDSWSTEGIEQNVFLVPMADTPIIVSTLKIDPDGYICFPVNNGKIEVWLRGLGDRTEVFKQ